MTNNFNIVELGGIIKDKNNNEIFKRNFFIDNNDVGKNLNIFHKDKYKTIYSYENTDINNCNFIAPFYLDLDIDDIENNYDKLLRDLKIIHRQLKILFHLEDEDINIYFSGSKGFHITVSYQVFGFTPSRTLNKDLKQIALYLKAYTITKCIDTQIYDYKRLFRISNTINSKTGLYKVPIEYDKLIKMTYKELIEYSNLPKILIKKESTFNKKANEKFYELIENINKKEKAKINIKLAHEYLKKKELLPCVKYILQNGSACGNRNNTTIALANSLFQIGNTFEEVLNIVSEWNQAKNEEPLSESEINTTVMSAFKNSTKNVFYGCSSFKELDVCIKNCPIHKR